MNEENASSTSQNRPSAPGVQAAIDHMMANKVDALLWLTRLATIIFTVFCLVPIGINPYICYQRALISSAATSALRLHQRLPNVQFTREFLGLLLMEDSCHYLMYFLPFYSYPITLALLPIFLFALLHSANYSLTILNKLGYSNDAWLNNMLIILVSQHRKILKLVSFTEVCLMPTTVFFFLSGKGNLLIPFVYYRFLTFRYASRRNPYMRTVFHELRLILEGFANTPGRSEGLRHLCYRIINGVSWLAPPVPHQS